MAAAPVRIANVVPLVRRPDAATAAELAKLAPGEVLTKPFTPEQLQELVARL